VRGESGSVNTSSISNRKGKKERKDVLGDHSAQKSRFKKKKRRRTFRGSFFSQKNFPRRKSRFLPPAESKSAKPLVEGKENGPVLSIGRGRVLRGGEEKKGARPYFLRDCRKRKKESISVG